MLALLTHNFYLIRAFWQSLPDAMSTRKALLLAAMLAIGSSQAAFSGEKVAFEWQTIGNPGNAADLNGFGAVAETFQLAKREVTNRQYAQFLNAKAVDDALLLYSSSMGSGFGGITRSGTPGNSSYNPIAGREDMPVNYVSYYDTLRFANWMHNGQGDGDTESGAYELEGNSAVPSNGDTVRRNPDSLFFLPTEDEWYKAAYHNASGLSEADYYQYPFRSDEITTCSAPPGSTNHANCAREVSDLVAVGSYPSSIGPYGTLDQGGNAWEWNVGFVAENLPVMRGGGFYIGPNTLSSSWRDQWAGIGEFSFAGFRLAASERVGKSILGVALNVTNFSAETANANLGESNVLALDVGLDLPVGAASVEIEAFSGTFANSHSLNFNHIESIHIYRDSGDGIFDQRNDTQIASDGGAMSIVTDDQGKPVSYAVDLGSAITVTAKGERLFMVVSFHNNTESVAAVPAWGSSAHAVSNALTVSESTPYAYVLSFLAALLLMAKMSKTSHRLLIAAFAAVVLSACATESQLPSTVVGTFATTLDSVELSNSLQSVATLPIDGTVIYVSPAN